MKINNKDELLREYCSKSELLKSGNLASSIWEELNRELDIIKKQGTASNYLFVYDLLQKIGAKREDYFFRGTITSSLVAYALGFSDFNPTSGYKDIQIYPEFHFGKNGSKTPEFEISVSPKLYKNIIESLDGMERDDNARYKYDDYGRLYGAYIISPDYSGNDVENDCFYINFYETDKVVLAEMIFPEIGKYCDLNTFSNRVKAFGLTHGTGTWDGNAKTLLDENVCRFEAVIAYREDVYEMLLKHNVDKANAYRISENVYMGRINRYGWSQADLFMMRDRDIPEWFVESCSKIEYLFPRTHGMTFVERCGV